MRLSLNLSTLVFFFTIGYGGTHLRCMPLDTAYCICPQVWEHLKNFGMKWKTWIIVHCPICKQSEDICKRNQILKKRDSAAVCTDDDDDGTYFSDDKKKSPQAEPRRTTSEPSGSTAEPSRTKQNHIRTKQKHIRTKQNQAEAQSFSWEGVFESSVPLPVRPSRVPCWIHQNLINTEALLLVSVD